ncbi:MAG TPA: delta-60 repeat domain-containing protein, partial [Solirubrobacterales bacterium]|nr:delta-60 repeat domain-containing protein [Solirubrobacterales bacterium]
MGKVRDSRPRRTRPLLALAAALFALLVTAAPAGANTMVVQPDGKIVLGGSVFPRFAGMVRYDANGALDPSFGEDGIAIERRLAPFNAIALQPDGRILAATSRYGSSTPPTRASAGSSTAILSRYLADGSPDQGFGRAGLASSPVEPAEGAQASAIVPRSDGSIALA